MVAATPPIFWSMPRALPRRLWELLMRKLLPILLLFGVGCQNCAHLLDCNSPCSGKEVTKDCPKEAPPCPPAPARKEVCKTEAPPCEKAPPQVEVKAPQTIHVKLPP